MGKCTECARTPAYPISCCDPLCVRCMPGRLDADWNRRTTEDRLQQFFQRHREAWMTHSLADLGRALGVSRERVRQLLPECAKDRVFRAACVRLQRYIAGRPLAVRSQVRGGKPRTGRACYGTELDPHYGSVVLARYESFSGKEAVCLSRSS